MVVRGLRELARLPGMIAVVVADADVLDLRGRHTGLRGERRQSRLRLTQS
jgi:hypothetical protein